MSKHKIIIDTDPGVDDAMAIFLAAAAEDIDVLGMTTIFGNVSVEQSTKNAFFLNQLLKMDIPIAKGASVPMIREPGEFPDFIHGKNGFGDLDLEYPEAHTTSLKATDFLINQIHATPGEVTLLPLGPLTNIAQALEQDPSIAKKVKQVVLMGGAAFCNGNVTPVAEANIWNDPHAAQKVFSADWPVVMVGLDVTHKVVMHEDEIKDTIKTAPQCGQFLYQISALYAEFYRANRNVDGFCIHDPATVAYLMQPELFTTQRGMVEVVTDGMAIGQILFAPAHENFADDAYWTQRNNVSVCTQVDDTAVMTLITEHLAKLP